VNAVLQLSPSGSFTARPETVGTTDEEMRAAGRGELAAARVRQIAENMREAMIELAENTFGNC
jgi:hypothetical protein